MKKYVLFGELVRLIKGKKHGVVSKKSDTSKRFIQIDDLRNNNGLKYTDDEAGIEAQQNDLLIAWDGANAGTVGWGLTGFVGSTIVLMRLKEQSKWNTQFLGFFLRSQFAFLRANTTGATIPHLSRPVLEKLRVPVFSVTTQRQIVHVLSRAEELITTRQRTLSLLDDFLKSTFIDLFGDPMKNEKGWERMKLGEVADIASGVTKNMSQVIKDAVEVPYMRVANVQDGKLNLSEVKTIQVSQREAEKYQLRQGDIILTEGGDPDKLGRGTVWNGEIDHCIHQNHIFRVRIFGAIEPHYLCNLISSRYGKSYFLKAAKQTTGIASINLSQLKNFPAYIPDAVTQAKFGRIVNHVGALRAQQYESLIQLQQLYQSLMVRAFSGQLDVSRVILPEEQAELIEEEKALVVRAKRRSSYGHAERKIKLMSTARRFTNNVGDILYEKISVPSPAQTVCSLVDRLTDWFGRRQSATFDQVKAAFQDEPYEVLKKIVDDQLQAGRLTQFFDNEFEQISGSRLRGRIKLKAVV